MDCIAWQTPPSLEFSRHGYWSRLTFPSPGNLPHPETEPLSPALQVDSLQTEPPGKQVMLGGKVTVAVKSHHGASLQRWNFLYLDCISVSILVVMLQYSFASC